MKDKFKEAMNFQHACKVFDKDKKISRDDFDFILESARLSHSSFGCEPWKFLVIQNKSLREKLKEDVYGATDALASCSHFVIVLARKEPTMRYDSDYVSHMLTNIHKLDSNTVLEQIHLLEKFQKDDFEILGSQKTMLDWSRKQTYIAIANMMMSSSCVGIDSYLIEGFNIQKITKIIKEDFSVDTNVFGVSAMLAFGYRANNQPEKTRQSIRDIVDWYE